MIHNSRTPRQVTGVRVERLGMGTTAIPPRQFEQIVTDAVRGLPPEGSSDLPTERYDTLAKRRKTAVRHAVLSYLQQSGQLFPED